MMNYRKAIEFYRDVYNENKHLFICKKCNSQWSTYPHKAKKNSLCGQCKDERLKSMKKICSYCGLTFNVSENENENKNVPFVCDFCQQREAFTINFSEKKMHVINLLIKDDDMPTRDIVDDYAEYMENRDTISDRHVQRIRKWFKANRKYFVRKYVLGEDNNMSEEDVFDTGKTPVVNGLESWELDVINMANEGGWSIQQLEERTKLNIENIKRVLRENEYLLTEDVLDEADENVYFICKSQSYLPEGVTFTSDHPSSDPTDTDGGQTIELANNGGNDEFWEVDIDCVTACSKAEKKVKVFMKKDARTKAMRFMRWAGAREWLAYLVGSKQEDGFHVEDLYLPDQRTSATLVDKVVAENYNQLKVVGVIHSHHEMGAGDEDSPSFSGHDANFINGNHDLSLLAGRDRVSGGFKIVGIARVKTPCGALMQVKAEVKAMPEVMTDEEKELKKEFFSKVMGDNKNDGYPIQGVQNGGVYHFVNRSAIENRRG